MLLDHTSRIPDYVAIPDLLEVVLREPARVWDPRELVRLATGREAEWRYSNTNYVLLGLVLEAATAKSLEAAALAAPDGSRCLTLCTRGALDESGWRALAEGAWPIFCHAAAGP